MSNLRKRIPRRIQATNTSHNRKRTILALPAPRFKRRDLANKNAQWFATLGFHRSSNVWQEVSPPWFDMAPREWPERLPQWPRIRSLRACGRPTIISKHARFGARRKHGKTNENDN